MSAPSNLPIPQPRVVVGLSTNVKGNAQFITDDDIAYPVGSLVAVHNFNLKKQKYIRLSDKGKRLTHLAISPNKKYLATVESGNPLPVATIWCPVTFKKRKTLSLQVETREIEAHNYVAVDFTFDSKCIVLVTGEPDWHMYVFRCDKGKLESYCRANNLNNTGTVTTIACNINDQNSVAIGGHNVLRIVTCSENIWKQYGYNRQENVDCTSCCWISQERLLMGTNRGMLILIESGELKAIYWAYDLQIINLKINDDMQQASQTSIKSPSITTLMEDENYEIRSMISFPKGIAFGYMKGKVHVYEREGLFKLTKRHVFSIPEQKIMRQYDEQGAEEDLTIHNISINSIQDRLMVTCGVSQIFGVRMWTTDTTQTDVAMYKIGYMNHIGPIGSIAVCKWKPLAASVGRYDRTLKLWNYELEELELSQTFSDDIYSVALHPTALYAAIGFTDKLRYLTIMLNEVMPGREFPIRACKLVMFSNMGHFFAATNANIIQVYSSITFENMYVLKGHNGRIDDMSWSKDDRTLATCGSEGAVYEWDVAEQTRISEIILKTSPAQGCAITSTAKCIYAASVDGHLRELVNSNITKDVPIVNCPKGLTSIALSNIDMMLFVSGDEGTVFVVRVPLSHQTNEWAEYFVHNHEITHMKITCDDRYLISASVDGTLCIWKLVNIEGKIVQIDKDIMKSNEILISRTILEDKMNQIKDAQLRLKELENEHAYQMRQSDAIHAIKIKDIHAEYCGAIEELKEKNEQMETDHLRQIHLFKTEMENIRQAHEVFIQKLEASYNKKLIYEYDKYRALEDKMNRMRKNFEYELEELNKSKKESEESITNNFLEKLREKQIIYEELVENTQQKSKDHELMKQQIEDDADREIYEIKGKYEKLLKTEQDENVKLRGETSLIRKKLLAAQKEIDDLNHNVITLEKEHSKFKTNIFSLEKDIFDLKKEIHERDQIIEEKEKRIFELKRKNQELEKFKFILDFKIKELKSQIEPKERVIQEQTEQINEMVNELENLQKVILNLDLLLSELREKLNASDNEVKKEIAKNRMMKFVLKTIKTDIHQASGYVQNIPMLTKCVRDMYHKYNTDKDFAITQAEDTEAKSEFMRQRDFLERTVSSLRLQATKNANSLSYDKIRLVDENAGLLQETNQLRKNFKLEVVQNRKLQSILGITKKYMLPRMAQQKLALATATREDIHNKYKFQLSENEKAINVLKEENQRLLDTINKCEVIPEEEETANSLFQD